MRRLSHQHRYASVIRNSPEIRIVHRSGARGRPWPREPPGGRRRGWLGFQCQPPRSPTAGRTPTERDRHTVASASRPAPSGNGDYTARHLQVLEGLEAVRKRPGMYIGSTDQRGLMHCLWEIIDNAVDEALAGVCTDIEVILSGDGSIEVRDNGRGIPVDIEPRTGLSGVEVVFTKLHAGGKFGGASYAATGGLHGVGASVVNALSARLDVAVDRGGKTYGMSFRRGEPGTFTDRSTVHSPDAEFTPYEKKSALPVVGKAKRGVTGSRVRFWPDRQIFLKDAELDYDAILGARPADLVPRAGPAPRHPRRATPQGDARRGGPDRGGLPARRRHHRLRRVPRPRHPGHRRVAPRGLRHLHRDRPGPRRQRPHDPDRARARVRRRGRAALGPGLRHDGSSPSSTSSRRPRAAPTWPASSSRSSRCSASSSRSTPDGSRSATTSPRRTTSSPA